MEQFATGFGKGQKEFGWVFGPVPGREKIAGGIKTTYAILVVPEDATSIKLKAQPRVFHPKKGKKSWAPADPFEFDVTIPKLAGFWVSSVNYNTVAVNERQTIFISGRRFSPQLGVLINGHPLKRVVSIAENEGNVFELVNSKNLVISYQQEGLQGTPEISLVTPQKALSINNFDNMTVNGSHGKSLNDLVATAPMFVASPKLAGVKVLSVDADAREVSILVTGENFNKQSRVSFNGVHPAENSVSGHQIRCILGYDAPVIKSAHWNVQVINASGPSEPDSGQVMPNPLRPKISTYEYLHYGSRKMLTLRLKGSGFYEGLKVKRVDLDMKEEKLLGQSFNELFVQLKAAGDVVVLQVANLGGKFTELATVYSLKRPEAPTIDKLYNVATQDNTGQEESEIEVMIKGSNLGHVTTVSFDDVPAKILPGKSDTLMKVRVTLGKKGTKRVVLTTDLVYLGKHLTNAADCDCAQFIVTPKPKQVKPKDET
jgi:hypothetical protein